jgi:hypothetical protein
MYASKARGGRAFFAGVGSAPAVTVTPVSSSSTNIATMTAPVESTTPATDSFVNTFGDMHNMSNAVASLYAAQSQMKPTFPPFGHGHGVMGDDGEVISVSSSNYGIKRSHDSMTATSTGIPPSLPSQPPPSMQSIDPSSDPGPSIPSISEPLPPTSPPKKRSKGSKNSNVIAPPSRGQKEKLTTAVAVNGMQGTINRMTDMLANVLDPNALATAFVTASAGASASASASASSTSDKSMGPAQLPPAGSSTASSDKRAVLQHLRHDDGLTSGEKARLLNVFTKNPDAVETYLEVLDDEVLRLGYARELLKDRDI